VTTGTADVQMRGILPERIVLNTMLDFYLPLRALAHYSGLSVRKLREYIADPLHPLPHYRPGGKIVVRRSEFDAWIASYRQIGDPRQDEIVSEIMASLKAS
jgi:Helix-turn-helix domain